MAKTHYSHDLRILLCKNCGAPVEATAAGGEVTCGYCQATHVLARRDESADLQAAAAARAEEPSESERFAALRTQDRSPSPVPDAVAALLENGRLPARNVAAARAQWQEARAALAPGAPFGVEERLFHLTLAIAPHTQAQEQRALFETAIEQVGDRRHRHVLRCMLARDAARAGDPDAAEAWLAACHPRPTDLAMDTALRFARATMATARGDHAEVARQLGHRAGDVPLYDEQELPCELLRLGALERAGRVQEASADLRALFDKHGDEHVRRARQELSPLPVAPASFAAVTAERDDVERAQYRNALEAMTHQLRQLEEPSLPSKVIKGAVAMLVLGTLMSALWTCLVTGAIEADPMFGLHAELVCPELCPGCRGPYVHHGWTTTTNNDSSDSTHNVYCTDPAGRLGTLDWSTMMSELEQNAPYELPGGVWTIMLTLIPLFLPIALVLVFLHSHGSKLKRREEAARVRDNMAATERALSAVGR